MNILITGATGLIGKSLTKTLREKGHTVKTLTRKLSGQKDQYLWNIQEKYIDEKAFENLDAIIHLAGAPISKKWTDSYKKELLESRTKSAELLLQYCKKLNINLKAFISASGVNYYGTFTSDEILDENSSIIQKDFLAEVCEKWEAAADQFEEIAHRVVCLRTGLVLAKNDGGLAPMVKAVDLNLGSAMGSGKQWMNWIHLEDIVNMYLFATENPNLHGKFNAVADEVVTNESFMKTITKVRGKFFLPFNVPAFMLRAMFGEMSSIILEGTRASNEKIKTEGFQSKYPKLQPALESLV